jgi:hypothetical protein
VASVAPASLKFRRRKDLLFERNRLNNNLSQRLAYSEHAIESCGSGCMGQWRAPAKSSNRSTHAASACWGAFDQQAHLSSGVCALLIALSWAGGRGATFMTNCVFCGRASSLLCDGRLANGKTCDKPVCRPCCGDPEAMIHLNMGRRGCRWDTRDLCPECRQLQRSTLPKAKRVTQ